MNLRTASALGAALFFTACLVPAQEKTLSCGKNNGQPNRVCEMRESTAPATGKLAVDAAPNGGIRVTAWDRNEILVRARVEAWGDSLEDAKSLLPQVRVETAGSKVKATGPRSGIAGKWGDQKWSVTYEIFAPRQQDLDLNSVNGGIHVADVRGNISFHTTNGGIHLAAVNGTVKGSTTNGGINVELAGARWEGTGMNVETTNGGVTVAIPASFQANVRAQTTNGGLHSDFPGAATDRDHGPRKMDLKLGSGGPEVNLQTTNGGIRIRRIS
ncbi:MAG: DUF4097 family beta strand repeat protein [Acidobacteria bacterium]|nr:DUF4097 family beta strand repeat protein [Acidobacteriota bacterium]